MTEINDLEDAFIHLRRVNPYMKTDAVDWQAMRNFFNVLVEYLRERDVKVVK